MRAGHPAFAGLVALSPSALVRGLLAPLLAFRHPLAGGGVQDYDLVPGTEFVPLRERGEKVRVRGHYHALLWIATYNTKFHQSSFGISRHFMRDLTFREKSL
jgi:hypothetical protein